jgi:hypothetical protein
MSAAVVRKPRSRMITGWRHVVPVPKGPKHKRPVTPVTPEKK